MRTLSTRLGDIRRLVDAARAVVADRAQIADEIARTTGLSPEGVELGLTKHVEIDPTDAELRALIDRAGTAGVVHVILSANVFVASLRAIAIARAASERVVVRPSRRDPVFARALVASANDPAITLTDEIDIEAVTGGELHVYGRDATIASVRARAKASVVVRGHGAGMGIALVSRRAVVADAALALASDVVAFDQRGCLSPRVALVEGDAARARAFGDALHAALTDAERVTPRGAIAEDECADAARWMDTIAFAGHLWRGARHAVGCSRTLAVAPPGRNVHIVATAGIDALTTLAPLSRHIVAMGADDLDFARRVAPAHARISALGAMQRPRLDGPVDLRGEGG